MLRTPFLALRGGRPGRTAQLVECIRRLGLPADYPDNGSTNLLPIFAPQDGVLLSTDVVMGEQIEPTRTLFVVADVRRLIAILHVSATDANRIKKGQAVRFQSDGGAVADIDPVNLQARMLGYFGKRLQIASIGEAIKHNHMSVRLRQQQSNHGRADEASPTRYDNARYHFHFPQHW